MIKDVFHCLYILAMIKYQNFNPRNINKLLNRRVFFRNLKKIIFCGIIIDNILRKTLKSRIKKHF